MDSVDRMDEKDSTENDVSIASRFGETRTDSVPFYQGDDNEDLTSVTLQFATPKNSPVYFMNAKNRGKCVIFNHKIFDDEDMLREGTDQDQKAIENTFGNLGFTVVVHSDLKFAEITEVIQNLREENHKDSDCICIFLLTHGIAGGNISAKDYSYPFQMIWNRFTADNCVSLAGKPKLFFIQACRGRKTDKGVQGRSAVDSDDDVYVIPTQADFLFGYSTVDGYYSYRDLKQGTWYIQTLCKVIDRHHKDTDLLKMLTMTSRIVSSEYKSQNANEYWNNKKQMPTLTSTLTRDLYFTPKDTSPGNLLQQ